MQNVHFTPPQLATLFKVNVSTIKRWVDKGMLPATKTPGGHRHITQKNLHTFISTYPKYQKRSYTLKNLKNEAKTIDWQAYYIYVQNDLHEEALDLLHKYIIQNVSLITLLDAVISPTFGRIQSDWQAKAIPLYEQHRMIHLIQRHLIEIRQFMLCHHKNTSSKKALLTNIPGDVHELGLLMARLVIEQYNWHTVSLGIYVSEKDILAAIQTMQPELICIANNTTETNAVIFLETIKKSIDTTKSHLIIGGNGWNQEQKKQPYYIQSMHALDGLVSSLMTTSS